MLGERGMRTIASAIVVLAGAVVFGTGVIGRAVSANRPTDMADASVFVGIILGLVGLIFFGISFSKEGKG
jgi:hypothetical protein